MKVPCPVCNQMAPWEGNIYRPFCGENCKNRDLGNWATESYRIPVVEGSVKEEEKKREEE